MAEVLGRFVMDELAGWRDRAFSKVWMVGTAGVDEARNCCHWALGVRLGVEVKA